MLLSDTHGLSWQVRSSVPNLSVVLGHGHAAQPGVRVASAASARPTGTGDSTLLGLCDSRYRCSSGLVVPDGLDALGLVSRHGLVTGRGEPVNLRDRPPKSLPRSG